MAVCKMLTSLPTPALLTGYQVVSHYNKSSLVPSRASTSDGGPYKNIMPSIILLMMPHKMIMINMLHVHYQALYILCLTVLAVPFVTAANKTLLCT